MTEIAAQILTAIALAATIIVRRGMRQIKRRSAVAARLRSLYSLVAALLAFRLLHMFWPANIVVAGTMIVAAWLPFSLLRLAEEMMRRHAPRLVKIIALIGALIFSALSLTLGLVWSAPAIIGLAVFQVIMVLCVLTLLWCNRNNVALPERHAMIMFLITVLLAIPLAVTDFQALFPDIAVRGGVFAIFLMLLATSRLVAGNGKPWTLSIDSLLMFGSGATAALALWLLVPGVSERLLLVAGACASAIVVLVILIERLAFRDDNDVGLLRAILKTGPDAGRSALLAAHPLLAQGILIDKAQLDDVRRQMIWHFGRRDRTESSASSGG